MPYAPPSIFTPPSVPAPAAGPAVFIPSGVPSPAAPGAVFPPLSFATATINVAETLTTGQTVTINGLGYTAQVPDLGTVARIYSDAATLASCINGGRSGVSANSYVSATVSGTLVTITALVPGTAGNAFTLTKTGAALTISGPLLTGGGAAVAAPSAPPAIFIP